MFLLFLSYHTKFAKIPKAPNSCLPRVELQGGGSKTYHGADPREDGPLETGPSNKLFLRGSPLGASQAINRRNGLEWQGGGGGGFWRSLVASLLCVTTNPSASADHGRHEGTQCRRAGGGLQTQPTGSKSRSVREIQNSFLASKKNIKRTIP